MLLWEPPMRLHVFVNVALWIIRNQLKKKRKNCVADFWPFAFLLFLFLTKESDYSIRNTVPNCSRWIYIFELTSTEILWSTIFDVFYPLHTYTALTLLQSFFYLFSESKSINQYYVKIIFSLLWDVFLRLILAVWLGSYM